MKQNNRVLNNIKNTIKYCLRRVSLLDIDDGTYEGMDFDELSVDKEDVNMFGKSYLSDISYSFEICQVDYNDNMLNFNNLNDRLRAINADYIVITANNTKLCKAFYVTVNRWLNIWKKQGHNNVDLIYCDEYYGDSDKGDGEFLYKPDFGPDTFRAQNLIGPCAIVRKSYLEEIGYFIESDGKDFLYNTFMREKDISRIYHIPKALFFNAQYRSPSKEGIVRPIVSIVGRPKISIMIPNKDSIDILSRCINSIFELSTYRNYEIIIIENNSTKQETFEYYDSLAGNPQIKVCYWKGPWNYSAINNFGYNQVTGDYVLLLNNDIEVIEPAWLEEMLFFAQRPDVGVVGAKLLFPDGTIQHVGVTIGVRRVAGHAFHGQAGDNPCYMNRAVSVQNLSAVTFACAMMKTSVYKEVGGLDEGYAVNLNDVDMCLRIREKGYLNVFTPYARLYHYESKSRGTNDETPEKLRQFGQEVARFHKRWRKLIIKGDPYYNINLSLEDDEFRRIAR